MQRAFARCPAFAVLQNLHQQLVVVCIDGCLDLRFSAFSGLVSRWCSVFSPVPLIYAFLSWPSARPRRFQLLAASFVLRSFQPLVFLFLPPPAFEEHRSRQVWSHSQKKSGLSQVCLVLCLVPMARALAGEVAHREKCNNAILEARQK